MRAIYITNDELSRIVDNWITINEEFELDDGKTEKAFKERFPGDLINAISFNGELWTAMFNSEGWCYLEDFKSPDIAIMWLECDLTTDEAHKLDKEMQND